jgi:cysteine desulfurase
MLRAKLAAIPKVIINSNECCLPHILNLSVLSKDAQTMANILDNSGIMVSIQTACFSGAKRSDSVFRLTNDERRAQTSIRISLSYLTTFDEINALVEVIGKEA